MDVGEAFAVLGLDPDSSWEATRRAHRDAIIRAHPDAGGSAVAAAFVNQAFDVIAAATERGTRPLPGPAPAPPDAPSPHPPSRMVPLEDPAEVLLRLADAAHDIGEVVFVDPQAGLLEVIVGEAPGVGQLTAAVDGRRTPTGVPVAFTLEALGIDPAPPIHDVVSQLMDRLRHHERRPGTPGEEVHDPPAPAT